MTDTPNMAAIKARLADTQATWDAFLADVENSDKQTEYRAAQKAHIIHADMEWLVGRVEEFETAFRDIAQTCSVGAIHDEENAALARISLMAHTLLIPPAD